MSYVVFSLAKCHLCDGDYDFENDAEIVQQLIIDEYPEDLIDYTFVSYDEDGLRDEAIDWHLFDDMGNRRLTQIVLELKKQNKI
jgi:hypothetical protein